LALVQDALKKIEGVEASICKVVLRIVKYIIETTCPNWAFKDMSRNGSESLFPWKAG
jgi:hypothetical protein